MWYPPTLLSGRACRKPTSHPQTEGQILRYTKHRYTIYIDTPISRDTNTPIHRWAKTYRRTDVPIRWTKTYRRTDVPMNRWTNIPMNYNDTPVHDKSTDLYSSVRLEILHNFCRYVFYDRLTNEPMNRCINELHRYHFSQVSFFLFLLIYLFLCFSLCLSLLFSCYVSLFSGVTLMHSPTPCYE